MKILKAFGLLLGMVLLVSACSTTKKTASTQEFNYYGEQISTKDYVSFDQMMKTLETTGVFTGKVKGKVQDVCQSKGCWMTLKPMEGETELFVKFKDYGFFMPFELGGSEVIIRGTAKKEVTSVKMLKHYAVDGGATAEELAKITEPETSFRFMADGVAALK